MFSKYKGLFLVTLLIIQALGKQEDVVEWKDFINGVIPENAIPSGAYTDDDRPIYIGLAHVVNGSSEAFIPTNVTPGSTNVSVTLDDQTITVVDNGIKVLVGKGNYFNKIKWLPARNTNFMQYFDWDICRPIRAGWQVGEHPIPYNSSLYIGRGLNGNLFVGKIYTSNSNIKKNNIMYTPTMYGNVFGFVEYEALVYYY